MQFPHKKWWAVLALAAAVLIGLWLQKQDIPPTSALGEHNGPSLFSATVPASTGSQATTSASSPDLMAGNRPKASPLDSMAAPVFKANSHGDLQIDPQTRVDVERVHALYQRDEALQKLAEFSMGLPAKAQRDLHDLYQQYAQYAQAVAQTYPPGLNIGTVDEARGQLRGLHELRQQYFGVEGAKAMFEQEEETSVKLIELMARNTDASLSMPEKAEQAQEAINKSRPSQP